MKYDALIVLGRGISEKGELPATSVKSVKIAKELLDQNTTSTVIFCGRWSRHYSYTPLRTEAEAMKELAIEVGIPESSIHIEDQSLDTISNFYFTKKKYLIPNDWKNILLLTLHKHDERSLLIAKYILGPEYQIDGYSINFEFPPEKVEYILKTEQEKIELLKKFFAENSIQPGDHEKLFQEHFRFIEEHNIPPTFKTE